jgi:hypothetical protein
MLHPSCRYYLSAADVDDETGDLSQRVQEAAGAALAEANERLMEAELKVQAAQVNITSCYKSCHNSCPRCI